MGESGQFLSNIPEILERMTDAFFAVDADWCFTYVNREASRLLFRHRQDLIGKRVWDEFPEAMESEFYQHYRTAMREQVPVSFEQYYEPLHTWYAVRAYPSLNGLSVYFRDITAAKQKRLIQEQQYKSLFEHNPDWVYSFDLNGRFVSANAAFQRATGYTEEELVGLTFQTIADPKFLATTSGLFEAVARGEAQQYETRALDKNGHPIDISLTLLPIILDREIVGVYGIAKDITDTKQTERRLQESQERYESLKRYNPNGIASFDMERKFVRANPAFEKITGYSTDELRAIRMRKLIHPEDFAWFRQTFSLQQPLVGVEAKIRRKNGDSVDVSMTTVPIFIGGERKGTYVIVEDITERKRMQKRLLETQRRYQLISENSQDIILDIAPDGVCRYASPSIQSLLGYSLNEVVGKSSFRLFHPEDRSYVEQIGLQLLKGEDVNRFTCRVKLKNGNYRWYESTVRVERDEAGTLVRIVGVGRDVSERISIQENLEQAVRIAGLGHWEWDIAKDEMTLSTQMEDILGWTSYEKYHSFKDVLKFIHPEDLELFNHALRKSLETGLPLEREVRVVTADGSVRYLKYQGEVVHDEMGDAVYVFGTCQDVTKFTQAQLLLQESEQRYERLVENSLDAVGIIGNGTWVFMNRTGLELFGAATEEDLIGKSYFDFLHPDHHEESRRRVEAIFAGQQVNVMEQKWFKVNGETMYLEVRGTVFQDTAVQVIFRDITEFKRVEEAVKRSEKLSVVGQLAAGVAHEIRNPLTALKGFTQLLRQSADESRKHYFEIMQTELERIEMISSELLALAKPQTTTFQLLRTEKVLQEVISLLETQAVMSNVMIECQFDEDVPQLEGEERQLKQVFVNLMKNAIEAMPNGGRLRISIYHEDGEVKIAFRDEGEGIPEDRMAQLGEPFYTTKQKGTGLGLMVCQNIISSHNGRMDFASELGRGTTVTLSLPGVSQVGSTSRV